MEVDTIDEGYLAQEESSLLPIHLWCFLGKDGVKKVKVNLDKSTLTLEGLKTTVCQEVGCVSPKEIDVLYNARKLGNDEALKSAAIRPHTVVNILKRNTPPEKGVVDMASLSKNIMDQVPQIALALRTAFFNPSFIPAIEKLGQSEMLENILAIAHGLKDDPVGIAIIQDPAMIFHLSDVESLKKLATTKPWVVEAFNFLAASVHQERGLPSQISRSGGVPAIFNPSLFEGDDDDEMEEGDDGEAGGLNSRITREQLSAALNSLSALGRGALSSGPGQSINPIGQPPSSFLDLMTQAAGQSSSSSQPSGTSGGASSSAAAMQGLLSAALPGAATGTEPLTADMVARAMTAALSRLPPDQQTDQFNAIRNLATQIHQQTSGNTSTPPPSAPVAAQPSSQQPAGPSTGSGSSPLADRYRDQLAQMREMGIHDQNLSILALRVSDGDVGTAVELIFSGWTGEGSEAQM